MELDISIDGESLSIIIDKPFNLDMDSLMGQINPFVMSKGVPLGGLDIEGLLPKMVRGIAGCEGGCPADAKGLVRRGHKNFEIEYIEGGIISAKAPVDKKIIEIKMFPEF